MRSAGCGYQVISAISCLDFHTQRHGVLKYIMHRMTNKRPLRFFLSSFFYFFFLTTIFILLLETRIDWNRKVDSNNEYFSLAIGTSDFHGNFFDEPA